MSDEKICYVKKQQDLLGNVHEEVHYHRFFQDPDAWVTDENGIKVVPERMYSKRVCKKCGYTSFIKLGKSHGWQSERGFGFKK